MSDVIAVIIFIAFILGLVSYNENKFNTVKREYYTCVDMRDNVTTNPMTVKELSVIVNSSEGQHFKCEKVSLTGREVHVLTKVKSGKSK